MATERLTQQAREHDIMTSTHTQPHPPESAAIASPTLPTECATLRATQRFLDLFKNCDDLAHGLRELRASGDLALAIPEFVETWGPRGEQSPDWHPEGSVWTHTLMVLESLPIDASYELKIDAAFHDIGKPATFFRYPTSGGITFAGHAQVGADMLQRVIGPRLGLDAAAIEHAAMVVEYHMFMHDFFRHDRVNTDLQQHILSLPCIHDLIRLQHADVHGTGISSERKAAHSYQARFLELLAETTQRA